MTLERKAALRSFLRSLVFAVAPVAIAYATDAAFLGKFIPPEYAALLAAVVGALVRAKWGDLFGPRPQVVIVAPKD